MKRLFICTGILLAATTLLAQSKPPAGPPKSPPATESATIGGKTITITYSSPRVRGREGHIFTKDGLISHDSTYPVWRAGANAATTLHTDTDLEIGPNLAKVPKGDYTLYIDISDPNHWVLIVNKQTGQWGTVYDKSQDLVRVAMGMGKPSAPVENLKYTLMSLGANWGSLEIDWENYAAYVPLYVH